MTETQHGRPERTEMQRSSRDPSELRGRLERWLAGRLSDGAKPTVPELQATSANGMSSETILFEARWTDDGEVRCEPLVARIAPDPADVPVFPSYNMERQAQVLRLVRELTSVPVPRVWWSEPTGAALGAPFFVMERVEGEVPPDVMPYNFGDSWLFHAAKEDQRCLQDSTIGVLADLHSITNAEERASFLAFDDPGETPLRRHVAHARTWYEFVAADGMRSPLVERCFDWVDAHWPADEGETVVSWGDSRIGNVMYRDFRPVAVLDWEMAGLGPRELDLAWLVYSHRCFEDMAAGFNLPGMPDFLRPDDVATTYESMTGYTPRDLPFYLTYAATQWGIVFLRTAQRSAHFGERELPADPDEVLYNREPIERMLAGTYWD